MAAATSIVPFQPPVGLPPSQALAHALGHIGKMHKKNIALKEGHEALKESFEVAKDAVKSTAKKHYRTVVDTMFVATAGAGIGFLNGRYGGDKGHITLWDVPMDGGAAVVSHLAGLIVGHTVEGSLGEDLSRALHAVGNTATGIILYRVMQQKGAQLAAAHAAPNAQPNGVKGGTVYAVVAPHKVGV